MLKVRRITWKYDLDEGGAWGWLEFEELKGLVVDENRVERQIIWLRAVGEVTICACVAG